MAAKSDLQDEFERLERHLPKWLARPLGRARKPEAIWLRLPLAIALIIGGIVGIVLPILGFWMTPLGLALLALDVPFLQAPFAACLGFVNRKLATI